MHFLLFCVNHTPSVWLVLIKWSSLTISLIKWNKHVCLIQYVCLVACIKALHFGGNQSLPDPISLQLIARKVCFANQIMQEVLGKFPDDYQLMKGMELKCVPHRKLKWEAISPSLRGRGCNWSSRRTIGVFCTVNKVHTALNFIPNPL